MKLILFHLKLLEKSIQQYWKNRTIHITQLKSTKSRTVFTTLHKSTKSRTVFTTQLKSTKSRTVFTTLHNFLNGAFQSMTWNTRTLPGENIMIQNRSGVIDLQRLRKITMKIIPNLIKIRFKLNLKKPKELSSTLKALYSS